MARLHLRTAAAATLGMLITTTTLSLAANQAAAEQSAPCRTSDLTPSWAPGGSAKPGGVPDEQLTAVVAVKNTGSQACTLHGYPKVTLKAGTARSGAPTETLHDQVSVKPKTVTLKPGASARFTLTFLSEKASNENALVPAVVDITPPGNTKSRELKWRWGPVLRHESATHPGNFVSPAHP
ncbi:DUF4232 domain-containing protein [Streptomyces sp. NPDC057743]|uniref:DUF4232 domain-containing protein n=1 Tax=Streptomyces sp. NPDC057743 TaxID=3346236 RepID=UPI003697BCCB